MIIIRKSLVYNEHIVSRVKEYLGNGEVAGYMAQKRMLRLDF